MSIPPAIQDDYTVRIQCALAKDLQREHENSPQSMGSGIRQINLYLAEIDDERMLKAQIALLKKLDEDGDILGYKTRMKDISSEGTSPYQDPHEDYAVEGTPPDSTTVHVATVKYFEAKLIPRLNSIAYPRKRGSIMHLHLSSVGDLIRTDYSKLKYRMKPGGFRYEILHFLAKHSGYHSTDEIAAELGISDESIRKAVGVIRGAVQVRLGASDGSVIEGRRGFGYRMSSAFRIT